MKIIVSRHAKRRVDIPGQVGHSFRRIPATHSDLIRPLIPEQSGQFKRA
jgi:hypothetical protein